ncbi:MAG: cupin domain-containing protein [Candidatus Latescibacteria bacterium]|nr:cupin domain-containing protein [bacterium]MBD3424198.1 cupin domain-containing protein [Candidatus Latescibacterota bacterium]
MRIYTALTIGLLIVLPLTQARASGPGEILGRYVEDFREDPASKGLKISFGVEIEGQGNWTVRIADSSGISLNKGMPTEPTFMYITDMKTLRRMDRDELAVITAMGRARSSDPAPMDFSLMEGYGPPGDFMAFLTPFTFHFWTREFPEKVRFGDSRYTRVVHGANVTALYYQSGFRSAWYQIEKGQHVNRSEEDQVNLFPTMVIFTSGEAEARIGGEYMKIEQGCSVLIPAGVSHEFWNDREAPAEFIIVMFGEGA